jgi:hypothetical protein
MGVVHKARRNSDRETVIPRRRLVRCAVAAWRIFLQFIGIAGVAPGLLHKFAQGEKKRWGGGLDEIEKWGILTNGSGVVERASRHTGDSVRLTGSPRR